MVLPQQPGAQVGTTHRVQLAVTTYPQASGKAGAFEMDESQITVDGSRTDLSWTMPEMIELAKALDTPVEASMTADPVYSAGGGPSGENIYVLTVDSTSGFAVGQYARGKDKPYGEGHVHEVLAVPDGTRDRGSG